MKHRWGKFLIYAGALALLISAGIIAYNIWEETRAADSAARVTQIMFEQIEDHKGNHDSGIEPLSAGSADDSENTPLYIEINGEKYIGILSIPALSLELPVNNSLCDNRLKETPCRYAGGINDSLVIAAHNYRNHFGSLANLVEGDLVTITDAAGVDHPYIVEKVVTMSATAIDVMLDDSYELTLFTCNYSGRARVAVRCAKQ